jgi:ribosomal protein L20A (L18A)
MPKKTKGRNKKFVVNGRIKDKAQTKFSIEVEAKSEAHARALVTTKMGSRNGLRANGIEIMEIKSN